MSKYNKTFIIIGGPSRSATNNVSAFLHLHDDVAAYGSSAMRRDRKLYFSDFKAAKKLKQRALTDNCFFNNYLDMKNKNLDIDKAKIIVLRRDHGESIFGILKSILNEYKETKLIYSLRRNLFNIFTSQAYNMLPRKKGSYDTTSNIGDPITNWQVEQFKRNISESFDLMQKLVKQYPKDVLLVDVTYSKGLNVLDNRRRFYQKILEFIGINSNEIQTQWIKALPVTNKRDLLKHKKMSEFREKNKQYEHEFDFLKKHPIFTMIGENI